MGFTLSPVCQRKSPRRDTHDRGHVSKSGTHPAARLPVFADHGAGLDRQLHRRKAQGLACDDFRNTVDLEHDPAGLDLAGPVIDRALTLTHTNFDGLGGHGCVREDPDPDPALTLHVTRHGPAGGFDLTRGDTLGLSGLQAEGAKSQVRPAFCFTLDAALLHLAEFCALWLQHIIYSLAITVATTAATRAAGAGAVLQFLCLAVTGRRIVLHDLTFEDPDLDPDDAVRRGRLGVGIVDIGAERVQRHTTLTVPFCPGDLGAAKAARDVDPDAERSHAHGVLNRAFHGTTERHATLELLRDALCDQGRVQFGLAYFDDVEVQFAGRHRRQFLAQGFDIGAFFADDHTRTRGVDRDAALAVRTLDDHTAHAGLLALFVDELTHLDVFQKKITVILRVSIPTAVPGAVDLEPHPDGVYLMSH